jgi:hypothetical protein
MERWVVERRGNWVKLIDLNLAQPWEAADGLCHYEDKAAVEAKKKLAEIRNRNAQKKEAK